MSDPLNIQDMTPFENTQEIQVTLPRPRVRRRNRCGHCRQEGHNRQTCPLLVDQRAAVAQQRREERQHQRLLEEARQQERRAQLEASKVIVEVTNSTEYILSIYWTNDKKPLTESKFKLLEYIAPWTTKPGYKFYKGHRIIAVPYDVSGQQQYLKFDTEEQYPVFLDVNVEDLEKQEREGILLPLCKVGVVTPLGYRPPKSELDQWKETAFKSLYLLKELERMGAGNNENLAPMVDMIQDIKIPTHTQHDKEFAGVPSSLTNIT